MVDAKQDSHENSKNGSPTYNEIKKIQSQQKTIDNIPCANSIRHLRRKRVRSVHHKLPLPPFLHAGSPQFLPSDQVSSH